MLTKKAKYALRALFVLAQNTNKPMISAEIAQRQQIPKKFLEAILIDLKRNGLLSSNRGRVGGYLLMKKPEEITLGRIIRIIDGPLAQLACASVHAYTPCVECSDPDKCSIRLTMIKVRNATAHILDNTTLADALVLENDLTIV
ncbi:Rrf2 family transcriptional regulator [Rhodocytophaga rosea]|uniref:Rrf2 family transcriptional regulator n=1 Tax=Rhodocytophaga rosea TaxID=2704465 RepID=A0A6C0GI54_9BACT|nr:Rrf2 family transcriptional regulator [Rhodocytophaga rosea]QHT67639.1 Rrf2 family transcriptional regulator [Rhodocytophaga rosea]